MTRGGTYAFSKVTNPRGPAIPGALRYSRSSRQGFEDPSFYFWFWQGLMKLGPLPCRSISIGSNMAAEPKAKGDVMQLRPRSKLKIEYWLYADSAIWRRYGSQCDLCFEKRLSSWVRSRSFNLSPCSARYQTDFCKSNSLNYFRNSPRLDPTHWITAYGTNIVSYIYWHEVPPIYTPFSCPLSSLKFQRWFSRPPWTLASPSTIRTRKAQHEFTK